MTNYSIAGVRKVTFKSYLIAFVLSIILTGIPFYLVMDSGFKTSFIMVTILVFAIIQILVHIVCFLHMRATWNKAWNWFALIYTSILLCMLVGASIYIMYQLKMGMMTVR
jgi:cytochrome o ubiquinol oxidase operon protein cyoD